MGNKIIMENHCMENLSRAPEGTEKGEIQENGTLLRWSSAKKRHTDIMQIQVC